MSQCLNNQQGVCCRDNRRTGSGHISSPQRTHSHSHPSLMHKQKARHVQYIHTYSTYEPGPTPSKRSRIHLYPACTYTARETLYVRYVRLTKEKYPAVENISKKLFSFFSGKISCMLSKKSIEKEKKKVKRKLEKRKTVMIVYFFSS